MSEANNVQVSFIEEVTPGTTPTGNFQKLRVTDESLKVTTKHTRSAELTVDGQVPDVIRQNISAGGDVDGEFSYGAWDTHLQYLLKSAGWSSPVTSATLGAIVVTANNPANTLTRPSGSWITDGILVNQWVRVKGYGGGAGQNPADFVAKVTAVAALTLTLSHIVLLGEVPAAGAISVVMGGQIVNGTTLKTITYERHFSDLTAKYNAHPMHIVESLKLDVDTDGIITVKWGHQGQKLVAETTSRSNAADPGVYTAAPTNDVMNAVDHVTAIFENGLSVDLTKIGLDQKRPLRARNRIATLGAISFGMGKIEATFSYEGYFADFTQQTKYINFTATSQAFATKDSGGNRYVVEYPRVKLTDHANNATGENTDVMQHMTGEAYKHATEGITCRIVRWPGP